MVVWLLLFISLITLTLITNDSWVPEAKPIAKQWERRRQWLVFLFCLATLSSLGLKKIQNSIERYWKTLMDQVCDTHHASLAFIQKKIFVFGNN